jgi:hypothetical protein
LFGAEYLIRAGLPNHFRVTALFLFFQIPIDDFLVWVRRRISLVCEGEGECTSEYQRGQFHKIGAIEEITTLILAGRARKNCLPDSL